MEGKEVGDFIIKRKIGEGFLGEVYLAEHRFIKKPFAIKCIPKELTQDPEFKEKFSEEISKVATLHHNNIASIHNVSSFEGSLFIVSDYVQYKFPSSVNLGSYLTTHPDRLKEDEILQILKEVAFALDYIHGQKILDEPMFHGGLKLSNILLSETNDGGYTIKLSDTGVASMLGSNYILKTMMGNFVSSEEGSTAEQAEIKQFMQTYAFLAPEQRFAYASKMNYKCDAYSFGVLAYFLLMGMVPDGVLTMPSSVYRSSGINWDMIIKATLTADPNDRVDNISALITSAENMTRLEEVNVPIPKEKKKPAKHDDALQSSVFAAADNPDHAKNLAYERLDELNRINDEARATHAMKNPANPYTPYVQQGASGQIGPMQTNLQQNIPQTAVNSATATTEKIVPEKKEPSMIASLEKNLTGNLSSTAKVRTMKKTSTSIQAEKVEDPSLMIKRDTEVRSYTPEKKDTASIKPLDTDTILIPAGEYMRGSTVGARDEKPCHNINVDAFEIDVHPVTNEQFLRFLTVMNGRKDSSNHDIILLKESRIKKQGGEFLIETGYTKHPVVGVSYYGAKAYADWVGKKLPTEAQWEIAASMGNSKNTFPTGEEIERTQANFFSSDTIPVMSYPASGSGLYDMAGNVYEWCEDWYDYNFYETSMSEPDNPTGPDQGVYRVLRGGCWKSLVDDLRCSHRFRNNPNAMNRTYGFRCVSIPK